jgi:hypothetical protein
MVIYMVRDALLRLRRDPFCYKKKGSNSWHLVMKIYLSSQKSLSRWILWELRLKSQLACSLNIRFFPDEISLNHFLNFMIFIYNYSSNNKTYLQVTSFHRKLEPLVCECHLDHLLDLIQPLLTFLLERK